jgi:hypothetical protein
MMVPWPLSRDLWMHSGEYLLGNGLAFRQREIFDGNGHWNELRQAVEGGGAITVA